MYKIFVVLAILGVLAYGITLSESVAKPPVDYSKEDLKVKDVPAFTVPHYLRFGTSPPEVAMTVSGLPHNGLSALSYSRPETAKEVTVILFTKDGRRWVARWEEIVP